MKIPERFLLCQSLLAKIGKVVANQPRFLLIMVGGGWGVVRLAMSPVSWRRAVKIEFSRALVQAAAGGLFSTVTLAVVSGVAIVAQAVYWLGFAGVAQSTGGVLAHVLIREIAPLFVSIILLGRTGLLIVASLCSMSLNGQIRALRALGIDPFLQFVMPKTIALTIASFTLGMLFSATALITGYFACWTKGIIGVPIWSFLYQVTLAMDPLDYIGIPLKFLFSGLVIGLSATLTGLDVDENDELRKVLPSGFIRGILSIMILNVAMDVVL